MIKVIENNAIDVNGVVYNENQLGYYAYFAMFIKKNIPFKIGSVIEEKERGRPRTSNRERLQLYVQEKHVKMVRTFKKGLDIEEYIVKKVNEGQESDVEQFTIETVPYNLIEFWVEQFKKEKL
jgi:hypothetical protein